MNEIAEHGPNSVREDEIPEGWAEVPVQNLLEKYFCGPSPDCEERQIQSEKEWGVLKTTAITWEGWNEAAHKVLPRRFWGLEHLQVQHGDVLITKAGPRDRVAVVTHVTTHPNHILVSGKMIALRPRKDAVAPQILTGMIALRRSQDFIHGRTTGMAESQVNFANTVVLGNKIRIPRDISEQTCIAEILDTLDAVIRETEAVIAKLREVKAGLLNDLLTRGLDEHGRIRDPVRHPEQFYDSVVGVIPKSWEVVPFASVCTFPTGQVDPRHLPYRDWPLIAPDHIESDTGRLLALKTAAQQGAISGKYVFESGDVIYSKIRPYLHKAVLSTRKGLCSADMYPLRPAACMNPRYLLMIILGESFSRFAVSVSQRSGFPKINREELTEYSLGIPGRDEQDRAAAVVSVFEGRLESEESHHLKLRSLKSGLAHDLLTGRVRVKTRYEPSVLQ